MRGQQVGRKAVAQGVPSSIRPFLIPAASAAFYPILPVTLGKHAPAWVRSLAVACGGAQQPNVRFSLMSPVEVEMW